MFSTVLVLLLLHGAGALTAPAYTQNILAPTVAGETTLQASACDATPIGDLYSGRQWFHYNMGDYVMLYNASQYVSIINHMGLNHNGSLIERYFERTRGRHDMYTFARVVEERAEANGNTFSDLCAVHVRTGDVIECDAHSVDELCDHDCYSLSAHFLNCSDYPIVQGVFYVRSLSYFSTALNANMSVQECPRLVLVSGANMDLRPFPKSTDYLGRLRSHLCSLGYSVQVQVGASPDDDLVTLATSRAVLTTGGGFSRLVAHTRDAISAIRQNASAFFDSYDPNSDANYIDPHSPTGGAHTRRP